MYLRNQSWQWSDIALTNWELEGDNVVVYDNHKKLSYPAVVSEILGTNNYLVISDNGPKHVSGDVMSSMAKPAAAVPADDIDGNHDDNVLLDDDHSSVVSDQSEDLEDNYLPPANINNNLNNVNNIVNRNRRGQREVANLGPTPLLPHLRSERNLWLNIILNLRNLDR